MKGTTHGVWNVEGGGPSLDDRLQHAVQEARLRPPGILWAELDVVAPAALQVLDGIHGVFHDLQLEYDLQSDWVGCCVYAEGWWRPEVMLWKQGLMGILVLHQRQGSTLSGLRMLKVQAGIYSQF